VFNYFGDSQNIEMNDKCQFDGWNAIQRTNVFVAILAQLFINYTTNQPCKECINESLFMNYKY
jgi:hypothetical protein